MATLSRMKLKTVFDHNMEIPYHSIVRIKPDKKYSDITHIKTSLKDHNKRPIWFHVRQSVNEILDMYYECKRSSSGRSV